MDDGQAKSDGLEENYRDKLAAIGRGAAGSIPLAGGILAEVVGAVIPGQRADRITAYLRALASRVEELEAEIRNGIVGNAEKIHLIEEGGLQSARATSPERIGLIVEAVTRGLNAEDAEVIRRKRLLLILGELDDDEVNLLNAYGKSYAGSDRRAFEQINRPDPPHLQSDPSVIDQNQLYELGKTHLIRLGLIKKNYGSIKKGVVPEFDPRDGDFKHRLEVSYLGRMLLREIGMPAPIDAQQANR
tara:strand:- start:497 stop:1231 length:735 start_codon:yes stop_codon:yes gene_type:complete